MKEHLYKRESFLLCFWICCASLWFSWFFSLWWWWVTNFSSFPLRNCQAIPPRIRPKSGVLPTLDAFLKFGKAVEVAYPKQVSSWNVSCAQYLPLVFRSLCASLLVVMTEMKRYMISTCGGFLFGDKSDLETTKNISMETNFGIVLYYTPQVARNKKWTPPKTVGRSSMAL